MTVLDFNDPFKTEIFSSNGNIFKNGIIDTTLTAKLFQNGEEVDIDGTEYTYTWTKVASDGTPSAFGTGKSKLVGAADFIAKANFYCDVD